MDSEKVISETHEMFPAEDCTDAVVNGAKAIQDDRGQHTHPLMSLNIPWMEVGHLDVEKLEKERYRLIGNVAGDEAVEKYKEFVWHFLVNKKPRR